MATKFPKLSVNYLARRGYAVKSEPKLKATQSGHGEVKQVKLPNGLFIAAIEDYQPISRIGVFIRAGSKFETIENAGVTHCLRNVAGLSTKGSTTFGITRNLEYHGGSLTATTTRDDIFYQLTANRDKISDNFKYLADTVTRPAFKPWEIKDFSYRMKVDNERLHQSHPNYLFELLHKACFRGGLANSLFAPDHMISVFDHNMLMQYFEDHYVTKNIAIVGQGVDLEGLIDFVQKNFELKTDEAKAPQKSRFVSSEIRMDKNVDMCTAAIVAEGASSTNTKEMLALALFQHMIGIGPRVKYNPGGSRIHREIAKVAEQPFLVTSLNANYSETGIFGFMVAGSPDEMHKLIKTTIAKMKDLSKNIKEDDLKLAKHQLKTSINMLNETTDSKLEEMGLQALNFGRIIASNEIEAMIDSITVHDLGSTATKVMKGKGAIASIGKVHNVPFLEDLA